MSNIIKSNSDYKQWLADLKSRIRQSQIKAAVKVNSELIDLYWYIGKDIMEKQNESKWGDGFINQLSQDLNEEFPDMKGFSKRNLELIRKWYAFYSQELIIAKQVVSQLEDSTEFPIAKQVVSQL